MNKRTLPHELSGGTFVETFSHEIDGQCSCGEHVVKVVGSSQTCRVDGIRYRAGGVVTGWGLFRCRGCKQVIEDTWKPTTA